MIASMRVFLLGLLCWLATAPALAAETQHAIAQHAIAMHGTPKYPAGFLHFDYVNQNAPKGGILKQAAPGSFDSLNPFIVKGRAALGSHLVHESLLARSADEPFTLYGLIAEKIAVANDRSAITFFINPKAAFHDGQPITANDVLFSYETLKAKGRPNHRSYYKKVARAEKIDARSVRFTFTKEGDAYDREMPLIMGLMPILPRHYWQDKKFDETTLTPPLGSGPYRVSKVDVGRGVIYERAPNYWGKDLPVNRGLYNFDQMQLDYYRDESVSLEAFLGGAYDLRRELDPGRFATAYNVPANKKGDLIVEEIPHRRTEIARGFMFNTRRAMFADPLVREAISLALDFHWLNKNLFYGAYQRSYSYFPNSELAGPQLPPDTSNEAALRDQLRRAQKLLQEAGATLNDGALFLNNTPLTFDIMLSDPAEEKIALHLARNLERLGIKAAVRTIDSAQFQSRLNDFDFDMVLYRYINSLSPGNEQLFFYGSAMADQKGSRNYPGIKDAEIDRLAKAIPQSASRADLIRLTRALDARLIAGHYMIPLYYMPFDRLIYWSKIARPEKTPLTGAVIESFWQK